MIANAFVRVLIVISLQVIIRGFLQENIKWAGKLEGYEAGRLEGSD